MVTESMVHKAVLLLFLIQSQWCLRAAAIDAFAYEYCGTTGAFNSKGVTCGTYPCGPSNCNTGSCTTSNCELNAENKYACNKQANGEWCSACSSTTQADVGKGLIGTNTCGLCPRGHAASNGMCFKCMPGKYCPTTGMDWAAQLTCPVRFYCSGWGNADPTPCILGYYCPVGSNLPTWCTNKPNTAQSVYTNTNSATVAECTWECVTGYVKSTDGLSCVAPCTAGTYFNGATCVACSVSSPGQYTITACTGTTNTIVTNCPTNTYSIASGVTACTACLTSCSAGFFISTTTCAFAVPRTCTLCPGGYRCTGGTSAPIICSAGNYCPNGTSATQIPCPAGTYCDAAGTITPTPCPPGTYSAATGATASSACAACPQGGTCTASVFTPCPAGIYCTSSGNATCPTTAYCPSGSSAPIPCPAGSFCPMDGMTAPFPCPAGFVTSTTSRMDCTACLPATYMPVPGQSVCATCPKTWYCPDYPTTAPTPCPIGTFGETPSLSACAACAPGSYGNLTGQSVCAPCPAGAFCPSQATMINFTACAVGTYGPTTSLSQCLLCPAGSYCPSVGAISTIPCPLGSACASTGLTNHTPCAAGTFAATTGRTACPPCPDGAYNTLPGLSTCMTCTGGTYLNASIPACIPCPIGFFCNATTAGACAPLPANAFFTGFGLSYTACPYACTKGFHGLSCDECPANSFCSNSTRASCPAGTVSAPRSTTYLHCACAPGTFGNVTGPTSASCVPCPLNRFCPAAPMTCGGGCVV